MPARRDFNRTVECMGMPRPNGNIPRVQGILRKSSHKKEALETVSVWLSEYGLVLGQIKTGQAGEEIASVRDVLEMLELQRCVVTADALHCQTQTTRLIIEKGGDYVLPVKGNQETLQTAVQETFKYETERNFAGVKHSVFEETTKAHGRIETRKYTVIHDPSYIHEVNASGRWWGMKSIFKVERIRRTGPQFSTVTSHVEYGISSLETTAHHMASFIRGHWGIENGLHWRLDVAFREDMSRVRSGDAPENLAILRRVSVSLLNHEKSYKRGLKAKRLKCAWNPDYLTKVLLCES